MQYPTECPECGSQEIVADYLEAVCQGVEIADDGSEYDYDGSLDNYDDSSTQDECLRCRSCGTVLVQFGTHVFVETAEDRPTIHDLFRLVREHPDYAGGTIWTTQDVADALYGDDDLEGGNASHVTEEQRQQSIKTMEHYVFGGIYGWDEAMRDNL